MKLTLLALALFAGLSSAQGADAVVAITARPQPAYIERGATAQYLNFDFIVESLTDQKLLIAGVELAVFDQKGLLVLKRFVDGNGTKPSVATLAGQEVAGKQKLLVINPFHTFDPQVELHRLRYTFTLTTADREKEYQQQVIVSPASYTTKTDLILPARGRLLVYDGHDFYGHHRRFDYMIPPLQALGFNSNFMRYSYDFVPTNPQGEMFQGTETDNASYFGFGAPLLAVGGGKVVALVNDQPDNRSFDQSQLATKPMVLFGNYLVIDHGNGEFSVYGHLKQGSAKVKVGETVKQGQLIGQIGASGSANFPHLHYELQNGPATQAEGLPSYFRDFTRLLGAKTITVKSGMVDTGDIVEAR